MIGSRLPQRVVALHSFITDQNVLHGVVKRMSHVKLSRDIRRRHYDRKRLFAAVNRCVKISVVLPFFVKTALDPLRIIGLC